MEPAVQLFVIISSKTKKLIRKFKEKIAGAYKAPAIAL